MNFDLVLEEQQAKMLTPSPETTPQAHLSHLEDLVIEEGKAGFEHFINHVGEILKRIEGLESTHEIGEKIDGSMAVYFGIDPRPKFKGQFSIATKSALSQDPKLIHSLDEIEVFYKDKDDTLKKHLAEVFTNLQKAYDYSGKIYMGDLLFSNPEEKKTEEIDGIKYLCFQPNTLVYAVEEDPESYLYQRLKVATLGIFVHDSFIPGYKGDKLELKSAGKNIDSLIHKGKQENVFIESSHLDTLNLKVPKKDFTEIQRMIKKAGKEMEEVSAEFNEYWLTSPLLGRLKKYLNQQVHAPNGGIFGNGGRSFNAWKVLEEFVPFVKGTYKKAENAELAVTPIKERESEFIHFLDTFYWMLQTKNKLLEIFDQIESKIGKAFIRQKNGDLESTRGEGFVMLHHGHYTKLVDRMSFTRNHKLFGQFQESLDTIKSTKNLRKLKLWEAKSGPMRLVQ